METQKFEFLFKKVRNRILSRFFAGAQELKSP